MNTDGLGEWEESSSQTLGLVLVFRLLFVRVDIVVSVEPHEGVSGAASVDVVKIDLGLNDTVGVPDKSLPPVLTLDKLTSGVAVDSPWLGMSAPVQVDWLRGTGSWVHVPAPFLGGCILDHKSGGASRVHTGNSHSGVGVPFGHGLLAGASVVGHWEELDLLESSDSETAFFQGTVLFVEHTGLGKNLAVSVWQVEVHSVPLFAELDDLDLGILVEVDPDVGVAAINVGGQNTSR